MQTSGLIAIGGFDPSAQAGVLADLRVWQAWGLAGRAVLTAVTAQSKRRFWSWQAVPLSLFRQQLDALLEDREEILGLKIGMLATAEHGAVLARWLATHKISPVLWDPVLVSSTGACLLKSKAQNSQKKIPLNAAKPRTRLRTSLLRQLLPQVDILTPNLPEAECLLQRNIQGDFSFPQALGELYRLGVDKIVLKGGHDATSARKAVDWCYDGQALSKISASRRPGDPRGTGCHFGAALLAAYVQSGDFVQATRKAKRYVLKCLFA